MSDYNGYYKSTSYWKGYSKTHGMRIIAEVYDKPQEVSIFGSGKDIAIVTFLDTGSHTFIQEGESIEDEFDLNREITQAEYDYLMTLARLETELFMHDYTGGFPRKKTVQRYVNGLRHNLSTVLDEFAKN